jgi:hypothetical protein
MIVVTISTTDNITNRASFPKNRPTHCGMRMSPAGGDARSVIIAGMIKYWRCEICGQETKDIAS